MHMYIYVHVYIYVHIYVHVYTVYMCINVEPWMNLEGTKLYKIMR